MDFFSSRMDPRTICEPLFDNSKSNNCLHKITIQIIFIVQRKGTQMVRKYHYNKTEHVQHKGEINSQQCLEQRLNVETPPQSSLLSAEEASKKN